MSRAHKDLLKRLALLKVEKLARQLVVPLAGARDVSPPLERGDDPIGRRLGKLEGAREVG